MRAGFKMLEIVELHMKDKSYFAQLMDEIRAFASRNELDIISLWGMAGNVKKALKGNYRFIKYPFNRSPLVVYPLTRDTELNDRVMKLGSWDLSMGDTDVF